MLHSFRDGGFVMFPTLLIGLVLVAGMAMGTAFTVFFVPAIYMLIAKDHRAEVRAQVPARGPHEEPVEAMP